MQSRLAGQGELARAHRRTAPSLQAVDAPFDGVAPLVRLRTETWWPVIGSAFPQAVSDLVGRLRGDRRLGRVTPGTR